MLMANIVERMIPHCPGREQCDDSELLMRSEVSA